MPTTPAWDIARPRLDAERTRGGRRRTSTSRRGARQPVTAPAGASSGGGFELLRRAADGDLHPLGLGRFGHRHRYGENAVVVGGVNVIGVQAVAKEQLAAERPVWSLGDDPLLTLCLRGLPLGVHRQDVLLDRQIDRRGIDTRQVEPNDEPLAVAVRVDGSERGSSPQQPLDVTSNRISIHITS
jgi:hypothetical protein